MVNFVCGFMIGGALVYIILSQIYLNELEMLQALVDEIAERASKELMDDETTDSKK